jgi:hypothetical protein
MSGGVSVVVVSIIIIVRRLNRRTFQKRFRTPAQMDDFTVRRRVGSRRVVPLLRSERSSHHQG